MLFTVFGLPFLIPLIVNKIRYWSEVVMPNLDTDHEIKMESQEVSSAGKSVNQEFQEVIAQLSRELGKLQRDLAKCRANQHL